jgi:hypothetical protein
MKQIKDSTFEKNARIRDAMNLISPDGYIVLWVEDGQPRISKAGMDDQQAIQTIFSAISFLSNPNTTRVNMSPS